MVEIRQLEKITDETAEQIYKIKAELSPSHKQNSEKYARAASNPGTIVLGAWDKDELAGLAVVNTVYTLGASIYDIDDVVVLGKYQGQGVGKSLMQFVIELARSQGISKLRLTSKPERKAANQLYQTLGFVKKETNSYRLDVRK